MAAENAFSVVQEILNKYEQLPPAALDVFGFDESQGLALWAAFNATDSNGEMPTLSRALSAAGLHFSQVRTLAGSKSKLISRKSAKDPWVWTKKAIKKMDKLVEFPATASAADADPGNESPAAPSTQASARPALSDYTLTEIADYIKTRRAQIQTEIERVIREAEEEVVAIERRRDDRLAELNREKEEFATLP